MMTDYNDGKWHGWNGGECPIHLKSSVEWVRFVGIGVTNVAYQGVATGLSASWGDLSAFRVVKAYREPRTVWAVGAHLFESEGLAKAFCDALDKDHPGKGYGDYGQITKFVEVIE